jgi:hypothetical protein
MFLILCKFRQIIFQFEIYRDRLIREYIRFFVLEQLTINLNQGGDENGFKGLLTAVGNIKGEVEMIYDYEGEI